MRYCIKSNALGKFAFTARLGPNTLVPPKPRSCTTQGALRTDNRLMSCAPGTGRATDFQRPYRAHLLPLPIMTLTKADLATNLVDQLGLNNREAKEMVEHFFSLISAALEAGEMVKLTNFGNFQLRDKPARPGRNPKTGIEVEITARRVATFHPSGRFKDAVDTSPYLTLLEAARA